MTLFGLENTTPNYIQWTMKKGTHGGKRENAGAKLKYGEPTVPIGYRVPVSKAAEFRQIVESLLKGWASCS